MGEDFDTVVSFADASAFLDPSLYEKALSLVSPERREKASRFRFASDRALSVCAELLLSETLRHLGFESFSVRYEEGKKPYLLEPSGVYFSLSHSGNYVALAISHSEIGIDLEKIEKPDLRIAKRFFTQSEHDLILSSPESTRSDLFYRLWTAKESYMKLTGLGMALPMDSFAVSLSDDGFSSILTSENGRFSVFEVKDIPGYKCSVCSKERLSSPPLIEFDLTKAI